MALNFDEFQNIQQRLLKGGRLIFPDVFFQELTYMEQIVVLWKTKQNLLKAGDNITLHENEDGTVTISAGEGGEEESYRIEEVAPTSGNSKAYALINATTGQQSGSTIQIPTAIKGDPGEKGDTGNGIEQIVLAEELPTGNKYRIDMTDGTFYYFTSPKGNPGEKGDDGFSPIATATRTGNTVVISITDANGTTSGTVYDGVSPTITVTSITGGHQVEIVTAGGTERFDVMDGTNGTDGISPTVSVTPIIGGNQVTITSASGTNTFNVMDGAQGVGVASVTYNSQDAQGGNVYDVNLTNGTVAGQITAPKGDAASGGGVTVTPASNYGREVGSITSDGVSQTLYAGLPYPDNREVINIYTNETALSDYMQVTNITCYIPETAYAVPVQLAVWSSNNEVIFTCDMDVNIYYYDNDIAIMNSSAIVEATYPSGEYIVEIPQFTSTSGVWDTTNRLSIKPLASGGGGSKYVEIKGSASNLSKTTTAYSLAGGTLGGSPSSFICTLQLRIVERETTNGKMYDIESLLDPAAIPLYKYSLLRLTWSQNTPAGELDLTFSDITSLVTHDDMLSDGDTIVTTAKIFWGSTSDPNNALYQYGGSYCAELSKTNGVYSLKFIFGAAGTLPLYSKDNMIRF